MKYLTQRALKACDIAALGHISVITAQPLHDVWHAQCVAQPARNHHAATVTQSERRDQARWLQQFDGDDVTYRTNGQYLTIRMAAPRGHQLTIRTNQMS